MKKKLILLLVGIFLIYWYQVSKVDDEFQLPIFTPSDLRQTLVHPDLVGKTTHEIPNFSFTNQNGDIVNQASVRNKIYIANFFFTSCPSICIDLTKNLKLVQNAFDPEDIIILSHSVDPQIDSVDRLKKYEELNDINGKNWFFLRGDINEVIKMAQLGYFAIASVDNHIENSLIHTENIVLVDKESKIRGVYNGTSQLEMSYLISDVNKLLNR
ncbi:MAG: SCO family protein [Rickettsiales bacterium TMED289]|nr:MAG: SCO family protein [Rickettsiales bacterium TMED289]|tara:strand:- start:1018 stop:1656 length:639 start_codon:yes stop_codon:yes gene_type:complete